MNPPTRLLFAVPLFAALVLGTSVPAQAQNVAGGIGKVGAEYMEQIRGQLVRMDDIMGVWGLSPALEAFTGSMNQGATERLEIPLRTGMDYRIGGVCDIDCPDLDLVLYDVNSRVIAEDVESGKVPIVEFTVPSTRTYEIEVAMFACSAEPCYWGVKLYSTPSSKTE